MHDETSQYRLVAVAGKEKGRYWTLDKGGLVVGRAADCNVSILDPAISRRQSRVFFRDGQICYEDLGSKNPALINGVPLTQAVLKPGDEIAIGPYRFILAASADHDADMQPEPTPATDTQPWAKGQPIAIGLDTVRHRMQPGPSMIRDLFFLYDTTRELSEAASLDELAEILSRRLQERFRPRRIWFALVHDERDLIFRRQVSVDCDDDDAAPLGLIHQALEGRQGLLAPTIRHKGQGKVRGFTLIALAILHRESVAVMALQTEPPHGAYDEEYLRLLVLLGQSIAPVIRSVSFAEQLRRENERLRSKTGESQALIGESRGIVAVRGQTGRAARTDLCVLITGETGTGKELAARMIHVQSGRSSGPFVVVNCAAIPRDLFESEFFGHEKGAFTGATDARIGLLEQASGGTLFLDEIGDLSPDNQGRILRCIETGAFRRVGGKEELQANVRVVAATNKDLVAEMRRGAFRLDLYHRLNGFSIQIPPLRSRASDIPLLADHFLKMSKGLARRPITAFAPDALDHLRARTWPGNVRELRNCIQRAVSVAQGPRIRTKDLLDRGENKEQEQAEALSLDEIERAHIANVLQWCGGDVNEAARILQISRATLYRKLAEHNLK